MNPETAGGKPGNGPCTAEPVRGPKKGEDLHVSVLRSLAEIEDCRELWEQWQQHPNADIDFYMTIAKCRAEVLRPHVILVSENSRPVALCVARLVNMRFQCRLGYFTLWQSQIRSLSVVYGGLMGQLGVDRLGLMISSLVASLREGDADVVRFSHLPVESEVWRLLGSLPSRLTRDNSRVESVHWKAILGRSYEDFLKSRGRNTRRNLKRYSRAFEEKYHERARVRCLADEREVELVMRDTELVAQKTYQRGLGAGFVANEETRQSMLLASRKGWLRAYVLYLDERPIAFLYGNKYGRTFYAGTTGFDPAHEADNVGTYLLARVIQDLYHENISEIDFGFGDAQYKQDLCDCSWTEAVRFVYAPTVRGLWIRTLRTVESLGVRLGRRLVGSGTVYLRLKTAWRKLAKP